MKQNYYFTFGQQYRYGNHPRYAPAHADGWVRIVAETEKIAREKAFEIFGPHWATSYPDSHWNPAFFPLGEIDCIEA